jgi:hypothetical protein
MRIWTFKEDREEVPEYAHLGRRAWRWVLDVNGPSWSALRLFSVNLDWQVIFMDDPAPEWCGGVDYYDLGIVGPWRVGQEHAYYDGPHCRLSVGFLHVMWRGAGCKRCHGDA